ncbi:MAG: hypothetical protein M3256_09615 [Actinomycetota bacterium]|nr:hypothetical protein [Actinomycetota bacterium]
MIPPVERNGRREALDADAEGSRPISKCRQFRTINVLGLAGFMLERGHLPRVRMEVA